MSVPAGTPPQLLVVEDDLEILSLVQNSLEEEGYAVTPASTLPASLEILSNHLFQLVLTDLFHQPGQAPLQSIQPLIAEAGPTPVGIMTAWPIPDEEAAQVGASFLLHKPFDLNDLVRSVQHELSPRSHHEHQVLAVEQFFAALNARDWKRLASLCAPQLAIVPLSKPPLAASNAPQGIPILRALFEQRFRSLPGYTIEDVRVYGRPLGVAARYTARWQSRDRTIHQVTGAMNFHFHGEHIAQIEGAF